MNSERSLILLFLAFLVAIPLSQAVLEPSPRRAAPGAGPLRSETDRRQPARLRARPRGRQPGRPLGPALGAIRAVRLVQRRGREGRCLGRDGWLFYKPGVEYLTQRPGTVRETAPPPRRWRPSYLPRPIGRPGHSAVGRPGAQQGERLSGQTHPAGRPAPGDRLRRHPNRPGRPEDRRRRGGRSLRVVCLGQESARRNLALPGPGQPLVAAGGAVGGRGRGAAGPRAGLD